MDWVLFAYHDFDGRMGRSGQFAEVLRRDSRVLWVNPPRSFLRSPSLRIKFKRIDKNFDFVALPGGFPGRRFQLPCELSKLWWSFHLRRTLKAWRSSEAVATLTQVPTSGPLALSLRAELNIYDCHDNYLLIPGDTPEIIKNIESEMACSCDFLLASSKALFARCELTGAKTYEAPNACNYEYWQNLPKPEPRMAELPSPRFLYYGSVNKCVDTQAVLAAARRFPTASFVFLGEFDYLRQQEFTPMKNIHLLGETPYQRLPSWVAGSDVCILPFIPDDWTNARDCLKLYEYLAAGKPVAVAPITQTDRFPEVLCVNRAGSPEGFADACEAALGQRSAECVAKRKAVAQKHTWELRVQTMLEAVAIRQKERTMNPL